LLAAAILHVALVVTINLIGRTHTLPQTFDSWGIGTSFAIDSGAYRRDAEALARLIQKGRFREWWDYSWVRPSAQVRPYSIAFAVLGPMFGYGTLAAEPLNLLYYLAILALTYAIGAEVFNRRVALWAATAVGLWPSLLLYTTQMLRDPLAIAATLLLVLALLFCISRSLSLWATAAVTITGAFALLLIWLTKTESWELVYLVLGLAVVSCAARQIKERHFALGRTIATITIVMVALGLPRLLPTFRLAEMERVEANLSQSQTPPDLSRSAEPEGNIPPWEKAARQVGYLRRRFIARYPAAGSNIDTNVDLRGTGDMIRYSPRAAAIGLFAPFPNMWFARGSQVGLEGRLLTGAETLIMYFVIVSMAIALIRYRENLLVWFLFATGLAGCVALAYVVVNMSSLYRMRYSFFILVIILGAGGASSLWERARANRLAPMDTKMDA